MSTILADDPDWDRLVQQVGPVGRAGGPKDLWNLWRNTRGRDHLILRGSAGADVLYRDLTLCLLLKLRRKRPSILLTDATWEQGSKAIANRFPLISRALPIAARFAIRMIDGPHVTYAVLSTDERVTFSTTWGVSDDRVVRMDFPATLSTHQQQIHTSDGGYLFSGGNSLRDYDLLEAALKNATFPTIIASAWKPRSTQTNITSRSVTPDEFVTLMANARACVVPLKTSIRSSGQQTYLNAMTLGKLVVVTDSPGVHDYLLNEVNALIVAPDSDSLQKALTRVMQSPRDAEMEEIAHRGQHDARTLHNEFAYRRKLLALCGTAVSESNHFNNDNAAQI